MADQGTTARIDLWLGELRMHSIRRDYQKVAREVAAAGGDFLAFLHTLLEEEVTDRRARRIERRIKEARFPQIKRLTDLDPVRHRSSDPVQSRRACGLTQRLRVPSLVMGRS